MGTSRSRKLSLLFTALFFTYTASVAQVSSDGNNDIDQLPVTQNTVLGAETASPALAISKPNPIPFIKTNVEKPSVFSQAVYMTTSDLDFAFYGKNAHQRVPVASLTKLATALVAVEEYELNEVLEVPEEIETITGSEIHLRPHEKMKVEDLLRGLLISSGNDAAYTLAVNHSQGHDGFVYAMNEMVSKVGLQNTHFTNPIGYDTFDNYSSASDMAKLSQLVLQDQALSEIVRQERFAILDISGQISHDLRSTNPFITREEISGVKTGTSPEAKENLILSKEIEGLTILIVILGSDDRIQDANSLMNWIDYNLQLK